MCLYECMPLCAGALGGQKRAQRNPLELELWMGEALYLDPGTEFRSCAPQILGVFLGGLFFVLVLP